MMYETRLLAHSLWLATLALIGEQRNPHDVGSAGVACIAVVVALRALDALEQRWRR